MARLQSDLLPALLAACQGELGAFELRFRPQASCAVVMAARGYPDAPEAGGVISGLDARGRGAGRAGVPCRHSAARRAGGGRRAAGC